MELKDIASKNETPSNRRKKAADRRTDIVHARATPAEYIMIREMADDCDMSISEYVIASCFYYSGKTPEGRTWMIKKK